MTTTANQAHRHLTQRRMVEIAANNEYLTRERVERLEDKATRESRTITEMGFAVATHGEVLFTRGFFGRLRWLFTGK